MKNNMKFYIILFSILISFLGLNVCAENEANLNHKIIILKNGDFININENLQIQPELNKNISFLSFWISSNANDVAILINNNDIDYEKSEENIYLCNISDLNIINSIITVTLSYKFNSNVDNFEKKLLQDTSNLTVEFNGYQLYSAENQNNGTYFLITLYQPSEFPLSIYAILLIIAIVAFLTVAAIYFFKKQKNAKIKDTSDDNQELLLTKKTILILSLKEVEKQHRAKKISDDTYHKLKGSFKQQAVEVMRKIEDSK